MNSTPKTVILTGASRGIGHATVARFMHEGWRIITCSREDVPPECRRDANWSHHIVTDLADAKSVGHFIAETEKIINGQPVHALVNNAAVSPKTEFKERLGCLNGDVQAWRDVFELNFFTPLLLSRGFAQALLHAAVATVSVGRRARTRSATPPASMMTQAH